VIGANDVVNPAARHDKASPIYGMPILDADRAKTVMAIKRSMNPGFAGIENELYYAEKLPDALRRRQGGGRRSRQGTGRFGGLVMPRAIRIFCLSGVHLAGCVAANAGERCWPTYQGSTRGRKTRPPASCDDFLLSAGPKLAAVFSTARPKIKTYGRRF
jgi:hypothetical protein